MLKLTLPIFVAGLIPAFCEAATISTYASANAVSLDETIHDARAQTFFTADGPSGHVIANAVLSDESGTANSYAIFTDNALHLQTSAWAERRADATPRIYDSGAQLSMSEYFRAVGSGVVTLSYKITGRVSALTDLADPASLSSVYATYSVSAPNLSEGDVFRSADEPDPLFLSNNGMFEKTFSSTFNIMDGEEIYFVTQVGANAGPQNESGVEFFRARSDIETFLTFETQGVDLQTGEGAVPAPVPLPSSALLFSSLLAGLGVLRRARTERV